ncbi:MAG: hypothetical protein WC678_00505 [Parcubacteria group bacterium]|jgi:DNA-binding NtrC family response regulator
MQEGKKKKFRTILLADSNSSTNDVMRRYIKNEKLAEEIISLENRNEQEEILRTGAVDVLVTGLKYKGFGIVKFAKELSPKTKIVICSGSVNSEDLAREIQPNVFIKKPVSMGEFIKAVRSLL